MLRDQHMVVIPKEVARERGLKHYFSGEPCKRGHVNLRYSAKNNKCLECSYMYNTSESSKEYGRKYREKHKDKIREQNKAYREENSEKIRTDKRRHYHENKEYYLDYQRDYYIEHSDYIKGRVANYRATPEAKEVRNKRTREKYREDTEYWAGKQSRRLLYRTLTFTDLSKDSRTSEMLGYSSEELWEHLKSILLEGMTEDNRGEWHVDHKIPVIEFIEQGIEDPSIINALDNLIPMWSNHNLAKNRSNLRDWLNNLGEDSEEWRLYSKFL